MSKFNKLTDQILLKVMKQLTAHEFIVFTAWFTDSPEYNAPQCKIVERIGGNKSGVSKAFKSLISKGIIEENGKFKRSNNYKMTVSFLNSLKSDPTTTSLATSEMNVDDFSDELDIEFEAQTKTA